MFCWRRLVWVLVVAFVGSVVVLSGCGKKEASEEFAEGMMERSMENASGEKTDVDIDEGNISIRTGDTKMESVAATEWPSDLPGDVPPFTYGTVERVTRAEDTAKNTTAYSIYLRDVSDDAFAKYEAELKAAGWECMSVDMGGKGGVISGQKGDIGVTVTCNMEEHIASVAVLPAE